MPPGHPIILLKPNLFNMAAVSVKRSIAFHFSFYPESYKAAILPWTTFLLNFLFIVCACNIVVYGEKFEREISLYNNKTEQHPKTNA